MLCWSCGGSMKSHKVSDVTYNACEACGGVVVPTLQSLALWRDMESAGIEEPQNPTGGEGTRCRTCNGPAETFGYQFTKVQVQRCTPCRMLFVPGDKQIEVRNIWRKANNREIRQMMAVSKQLQRELRDKPLRRAHTLRNRNRHNNAAAHAAERAEEQHRDAYYRVELGRRLAELEPEDESS